MEVYWEQPHWDYIDPFPDQGLYRVRQNGRWGIVNENRQVVIPCRWEYIGQFWNHLIFVKEQGLWGILRMDGTLAVACEWSYMQDVPGEPGWFLLSGKDKTGKEKTRKVNLLSL